jgi:RimJ/RimL family protein N-acetyltransferase
MPQKTQLVFVQSNQEYIDQCFELYLEDDNWNLIGDIAPFTKEEFEEDLEKIHSCPAFALVENKKIIGFCSTYSKELARYCELRFVIRSKFRNKGYGKELLEKTIEQLKKLNLADYISAFTESSVYSEKLLTSIGFTRVGTFPERTKLFRNGEYVTLDQTAFYLKIK